jgi:hypothetical protein|tara:strand:+ start:391 stop:648 length:258 start_codon:yes stop_codon:yes gene_type:complete
MQIFKVIGNTIAAAGQTVQDTAELVSLTVGDEGLKHTTRQSFKIINTALDESVEIALLETEYNLREFRKNHSMNSNKGPGRPKKS